MGDGGRRRLSKAQRRQEILRAARRVFRESGLQGARTKEIARAAGINEALIYQHFQSKEELFEAAVLSPLEDIVDDLYDYAHALPPGTDERQRTNTYSFVHNLLETLADSLPLLGVVLFTDGPAGREFYQSRVAALLDSVTDVVKSNLGSWQHRCFDPEITTPAIFGMCWGLAMDAVLRGRDLDVEAAAEEICRLIFRGLGAEANLDAEDWALRSLNRWRPRCGRPSWPTRASPPRRRAACSPRPGRRASPSTRTRN
jgi:AcrR family transcriptional regulator